MNPYQTLTITEIVQEVNNVKLFYLQASGDDVMYKPGQYLTFILPQNERELRRSYSLVSSPFLGEQLCIAVKRIQNGIFSRHLYDRAEVGDQLITLGPGGLFVLPEDVARLKTLFFFAAGTGIVPIFSMIKTALALYAGLQIVLIYSNNSRSSTLFHNHLTQLVNQYPSRFRPEFIFSDAKFLDKARLHPELIRQVVRSYNGGDEGLFYLCGPESYMRLCTFVLRQIGVEAEQIRREVFDTSKAVPRLLPPDTHPHNVTLMSNGMEHYFNMQYPQTILGAAREQGIVMPYSCEAGRCGNCMAKCEAGQVWMSYNEVLTDKEISQGYVLTCTGYPVGADVRIRI